MSDEQGRVKSREELYADHPRNAGRERLGPARAHRRAFLDGATFDALRLYYDEESGAISFDLMVDGERVELAQQMVSTKEAADFVATRLSRVRDACEEALSFVASLSFGGEEGADGAEVED